MRAGRNRERDECRAMGIEVDSDNSSDTDAGYPDIPGHYSGAQKQERKLKRRKEEY